MCYMLIINILLCPVLLKTAPAADCFGAQIVVTVICGRVRVNRSSGTHEDERTVLIKTISLDGIKPNTNLPYP